jgi:hypothetical protein
LPPLRRIGISEKRAFHTPMRGFTSTVGLARHQRGVHGIGVLGDHHQKMLARRQMHADSARRGTFA